jgi:Tfp pilus assembly protein FimT
MRYIDTKAKREEITPQTKQGGHRQQTPRATRTGAKQPEQGKATYYADSRVVSVQQHGRAEGCQL